MHMSTRRTVIKYEKHEVEPNCQYCARCGADAKRRISCRQKAEKKGRCSCRRFVYDPLRREPLRPAKPPVFTAEDFKL